jgi:formate dehydrogenase subunit gamma
MEQPAIPIRDGPEASVSQTQAPARTTSIVQILRFDRVQRTAHWANAMLFLILMVTALPLYFGSLSDIVGRRHLVAEIHLWTGVALPFPMILSLIGPWGARMRRDVRRINRWTREEIRWLRRLGRTSAVLDKFNPGQKLNAIFTGAVIVVMLATGSMLQWFRFFPVSWRTGATLVHDTFAFMIFAAVIGHVLFAVSHPESMRSMIKGWVTDAWARRHAVAWLNEQSVDPARVSSRPRSTQAAP